MRVFTSRLFLSSIKSSPSSSQQSRQQQPSSSSSASTSSSTTDKMMDVVQPDSSSVKTGSLDLPSSSSLNISFNRPSNVVTATTVPQTRLLTRHGHHDPRNWTRTEGNAGSTSTTSNGSSSTNPGSSFGKRRGKCKWFNVAKGWGFITPLDGGSDVFVHQSVLQMNGFRSLGEDEDVEFECKPSDKGLEATMVTGVEGNECKGSDRRPMSKKIKKVRCYNCGEFANHVAAKCSQQPQPKKCHRCKAVEHLIADCPFIIHSSKASSSVSAKNIRNKTNNKTFSETTINSDGLSTHTDHTFSDIESEENIQTAITA